MNSLAEWRWHSERGMKSTIYLTCKTVRHTECYTQGVIFIIENLQDPHKIRISWHCPKLIKKKNKTTHGVGVCTINIDTYVCKRQTLCSVRAWVCLPWNVKYCICFLSQVSRHIDTPLRDLGGCKIRCSELGEGRSMSSCAAVASIPTPHLGYSTA